MTRRSVGVVEAHDVAVAGGADVGLEVGQAERGGPPEGGERVLGGEPHAAAVGDGERSGVVAVAGHAPSMCRSADPVAPGGGVGRVFTEASHARPEDVVRRPPDAHAGWDQVR